MVRQAAASFLLIAMLLVAGRSSAQQQPPSSNGSAIQIGLRFGYGVPFGQFGQTSDELNPIKGAISSFIAGQIPIGLDAGYLITPHVYVGLLFLYGFGVESSAGRELCDPPSDDCVFRDTSLGVDVQFHVKPSASFDPWVGLGAGYEWFDWVANPGLDQTAWTAAGFQYANVQIGGDVRLAPNLAAGPFVSISSGQFATLKTVNGKGARFSGVDMRDYVDKSFHEWLLFGVRGVYNIRL